jgi:hypothetical protein
MKIFVSSAVYGSEDLRSAIKSWLEELGHEVLLSEEPDFGADQQLDSINACIDRVRSSDAYILIIGDRTGNLIPGTNISITRKEYETAYQMHKTKRLPVINFVRFETKVKIDDLKMSLKNAAPQDKVHLIESFKIHHSTFDNPTHVIEFIDEVRRVEEIKKAHLTGNELPTANWLNVFRTFDEFKKPITVLLNMETNLSRTAKYLAVITELKDFLLRYSYKFQGSPQLLFYPEILNSFLETYSSLSLDANNLGQIYRVSDHHKAMLITYFTQRVLPEQHLDSCRGILNSEELLEFDSINLRWRFNNVHSALRKIIHDIQCVYSESYKKIYNETNTFLMQNDLRAGIPLELPLQILVNVIHTCNQLKRAILESLNLIFHLQYGNPLNNNPARNIPLSPFIDQIEGLADETVTPDLLDQYLKKLFEANQNGTIDL